VRERDPPDRPNRPMTRPGLFCAPHKSVMTQADPFWWRWNWSNSVL